MKNCYPPETIEDLPKEGLLKLIPDIIHRMIVHYGLWFTEVRHQMGAEKAMAALGRTFDNSLMIQMKHLSKALGFELEKGLPKALAALPRETLLELVDALSKTWLANDGVWFQSVEFTHGMNDAKRCNESCWGHFSPFEAWSIKRFLNLGDAPGLEGLAKALGYRIYARINTQSVIREEKNSLLFQMNRCRVQAARHRKGLAEYPCKSGGLVEYAYFATAIDSRINTECVGCPPDPHPKDWHCAWRFTIDAA